MTEQPSRSFRSMPVALLVSCAGLTALLLWSYGPALGEMAYKWHREPQYSHGYLVPLFALALLWMRRQSVPQPFFQPSWWGVGILVASVVVRLTAAFYFFEWVDAITILGGLAGVVVLFGGWPALRWAWPSVAFLFFMVPLPYRVEILLGGPLQQLATISSTYVLQTLGQPAVAEGNTINIHEIKLGIVEACSGLRMLIIFFALSTGVALVIHKRLWEKALIVASAIPIALVTNIVRITATGLLHVYVSSEVANAVFHDLAGWLMMPFALVLLWVELRVMATLLIEPDLNGPVGLHQAQFLT